MPEPEPGQRYTFADFQKADERGLECPRCGCGHFEVVETRPAPGGRIRRRRECRHCGWRITTLEMRLGDAEEFDSDLPTGQAGREPVPADEAGSEAKSDTSGPPKKTKRPRKKRKSKKK